MVRVMRHSGRINNEFCLLQLICDIEGGLLLEVVTNDALAQTISRCDDEEHA
jgi:hypothetical protein